MASIRFLVDKQVRILEMSIKNGQSMVLLPGKDRAETTIGPRVGT